MPDTQAAGAPAETVHVPLGDRAYDIVIGPGVLHDAGRRIAAVAPGAACAIVTDENVARVHLPALSASLAAAGVRATPVVVPPGEASKSYAMFETVCDAIIAARMERGDLVVALGGGVVGDLAGFAAASVRRGMRFVQIPTSLLAQVDSSVGGKTGINSPHGKNLVGAFHQPRLVLADTAALDTLPPREFRAGYAEVAKYGLIDDPAFFAWLEENHRAVFAGGAARVAAIRASCAAKAAVVVRDEREDGDRALLNLGHTFAHAFERITRYDGARLVHGEAVAIGLVCAFAFSARLGLASGQDASRVAGHLRTVGLPTAIRDIPGWDAGAAAILDAMAQDKKVRRGALTFILANGIGRSFVARDVDAAAVRAFLDDALREG
ncbi:3-dehydroquinate synthase [Alsobacter sp. SYSU M60028]|uniref:3-dehydroquinate synthase n=1 Tax=Alsobacter ponti TaxID=2962936 RepID=A0ABT1LB34_9HYPH|nr:3-dehydroquinate synthase [Alsobacter ponti]MCP8938695.1 3-dehydroquinate synthase [Alsobacter ponti]